MRVLVTGGAGYVGSACLRNLLREGHEAIAYDNLSEGHRTSELTHSGTAAPHVILLITTCVHQNSGLVASIAQIMNPETTFV